MRYISSLNKAFLVALQPHTQHITKQVICMTILHTTTVWVALYRFESTGIRLLCLTYHDQLDCVIFVTVVKATSLHDTYY